MRFASRAPLLAAAVAAALLAGCVQPGPAPVPAATPAADVPTMLDFAQADCESMTWSVPVTAAALQARLPPGFEPGPPEAAGASPDGIDAAATLGFRAIECASGLGVDDVLRSVQTGWVFTTVLPPADLREERFGARYTFGWDVLVAPEEWRGQAAAWGLPLRDGGAIVGPSAQGWSGALAMDRAGSFSVAGRPLDGGRATASDFEARAITSGSQGFALWDSEAVNVTTTTGVGLWTASPESWVAQVLGATQGVATFEYCTFDLPRGIVHWPGQALGPVEDGSGPLSLPALSPILPRP